MAGCISGGGIETLQVLARGLGGHGKREAIVAFRREGEQRLSFAELADTVEQLAWGLAARGLGKGEAALICATNRPEWIYIALAILRAGASVVPVDAQMADRALSHVLGDSGAKLVFATPAEAERIGALPPPAGVEIVLLTDQADGATGWKTLLGSEFRALPEATAEDIAALFYTSGTTGVPKGVPLTHRNICFQINMLLGSGIVNGEDRVLLPLPFHHVYPFVVGILTAIAGGMPLILPRALTGPQIVEAIRAGRATLIIGVPRLYTAMFTGIAGRVTSRGKVAAALFRSLLWLSGLLRRRFGVVIGRRVFATLHGTVGPDLRLFVSGGAALNPDLAWKLQALGWTVATGYGLTETAPLLTICMPGTGRLDRAGKPAEGIKIRIDQGALAERGGEVGADKTDGGSRGGGKALGEVLARGPNIFSGYLNLPEETARAIDADGWFHTGDLGAFDDDGSLMLSGRLSTMIVTEGGKNVHPEDVEEAYQASPLVREIVVLERDHRLVGLIVPETKALPGGGDPAAAREAVGKAVQEISRKLASYQRISDFVLTAETLPRTRLGKPRRHLLAERYDKAERGEGPSTERKEPIAVAEMTAEDRTLLEDDAVRATWAWLAAKFPEKSLKPDSNIQLDLGVDSMEWLNITLEIAQRSGIELDEGAIARIETVRDLLVEVGQGAAASGDRAALLDNPEGSLRDADRRWIEPLTPGQVRVARAFFVINDFIMKRLFRLEAIGLENLPQSGPYVIAPTHASLLDPFAVGGALDYALLRQTFWAGWTGIAFTTPLHRWFSRICQVVPIDPDRAVISSLALAGAVLRRGHNLIWFPEGERSSSGQLQEFRAGIGLLLDHAPAPVVPVVIEGAFEAWPRQRTFPRFRPIRVLFHPPVDPKALAGTGKGETPQARIASALHAHVECLIAAPTASAASPAPGESRDA